MDIVFSALHLIDHVNNTFTKKEITGYGQDLNEYVNNLITEIVSSNNNRKFVFRSENTEVRSAINLIMNGDSNKGSLINVNRLLTVEKKAQEDIAHLSVKIQKGSLFQVYINGKSKSVILCKADHTEILDEDDFSKRKGLPLKQKIFKAILIKFNEDETISEIIIFDTNQKISKYWWYDFLELEEKYTDIHNTKTSLDLIDRKIFNPIKNDYYSDYIVLRNTSIGYFRNKSEFDFDEYYTQVAENYIPIEDGFPLEKFQRRLKELPEKSEFDTKFSIKKEEITKRIINHIKLTDQIDLVFKDHISNLLDTIKSEKDKQNNYWIKIKTDKEFKFNKKNGS